VDSAPGADSAPGLDGTLDGTADGKTLDGGGLDGAGRDQGAGPSDATGMEAAVHDGSVRDGPADGGMADAIVDGGAEGDACTPLTGADFYCGTAMCNGITSYCLHGYQGQACTPMPSHCQCAETRGCDCLLANADPCDAGPFTCSAVLFDGGLLFLQALNCP
jgi:hypothetical protein